jgi:hypothetical protein
MYNLELGQCNQGMVLTNHGFCTNQNVHYPRFANTIYEIWLSTVIMRLSFVMFVSLIIFCMTTICSRDDYVISYDVHKHIVCAYYLILQDPLFDLCVQ